MALESKDKAVLSAVAAREKKASDILVLELKGLSTIADYFLICSGITTRQVKAVAEAVEEKLSKETVYPSHIEGLPDAHWVLMDYGDLVVHVFDEDTRHYYELEKLWGDAQKIEI
ncbi:MAG: ribosome silencing factor [Nitrospirota bacterium]